VPNNGHTFIPKFLLTHEIFNQLAGRLQAEFVFREGAAGFATPDGPPDTEPTRSKAPRGGDRCKQPCLGPRCERSVYLAIQPWEEADHTLV